MGRKAKFTEGVVVKKGPGRKARKQKDPSIPLLDGMFKVMFSMLVFVFSVYSF